DTWLVSPQTVVSSRLVANYTDIRRLGAAFFNFGDIGVKNYYSGYQPKYLQLTVNDPGFALGGGTANDSTYRTFSSGLNMDASLTVGRVTTYSQQPRAAGIRSAVFTKAPLGFSFPGDPGFPGKTGRDRNLWEFAPRFGFAWDVNGDGRTSVRASTGIGYDFPNAQYHLWTGIVPPFGSSTTLINPSFDDPWGTVPGGNPFPVRLGPDASFVPFGGFTT